MPEVKIILSAETKQAVQAFNAFKEQANVGKDALQALSQAGRAFGSQVSPQLTAGVSAVAESFKALAGSAKLGSAAIGAYALGAGVVFMGWKLAIDEVRESMKKLADEQARVADFSKNSAQLIETLKSLQRTGGMSQFDSQGLINQLRDGNTQEKRDAAMKAAQDAIAAAQKKTTDKRTEAIAAEIEYQKVLKESQSLLLTGIEKEKAEVIKAMDELVAKGTALAAKAGVSSQPLVDLANASLRRQLGEIDAKEAERVVEAQRKQAEAQNQITEEIRQREQRADEFYRREDEHTALMLERERQRNIQAIERNPYLTESERFGQMQGAGADMSNEVDPSSFSQTMQAGLAQLSSSWELAGNAARVAMDAMQLGVNGVTNGIMGAITGTMTWGQAFTQVARQIIASLIQIVVQWIAQQTIVRALRAIFTAESSVQAAATEQAWAPAAYAASVATYGYAAVVGAASVIAGLGTTMAAFMAAGFADGGYTGDGPRDGIAGVVHYGEVVIPADIVDHVRRGQSFSSPIETSSAASSGSSNVSVKTVVVANMQDAILEAMKSPAGERVIVQTVDGRRLDLGLQT